MTQKHNEKYIQTQRTYKETILRLFLLGLKRDDSIKYVKKDLKIKSGMVDLVTIDKDNIPTLIFSEPSFSKKTILKILNIHYELINEFTAVNDLMLKPSIIRWTKAKSLCLALDPSQEDLDYIVANRLPIEVKKYDASTPAKSAAKKTELIKSFLKLPSFENFKKLNSID